MASCDDDFSLIGDDRHRPHHHHIVAASHPHQPHHHQFTHPHSYFPRSPPIHSPPDQPAVVSGGSSPTNNVPAAPDAETVDYRTSNSGFCSHDVNPFSAGEGDPNSFEVDSDPNGTPAENSQIEKRKDRDNLSDGGASCSFKKTKLESAAAGCCGGASGFSSNQGGMGGGGGAEYRKDREEWSDFAIECLLEAYTEKFNQLNRGNLRGRDWEDVAGIVSERCENQTKTVEQCKNKVDNLKKRYKLERQRMTTGGVSSSHWPWFKRMEAIVGINLPAKAVNDEESKAGGGGIAGSTGRQQKRNAASPATPLGQINSMKPKSIPTPRWHRVVFKISGAAFAGDGSHNVDPKVTLHIAREVAIACRLGVQVAIVVGGRNFFCGDAWINATGSDRSTTYQIGMMATLMNAVLLQSALEKMGVQTRVQTAFALPEVGEPYNRQRAIRHLEKGRVVIFGGVGAGSGNPLFSTDTVAALRASEIQAVAILKGINVDVIGDCNAGNSNITIEHISFRELASRGSSYMDIMALTLCEENGMPG
ncbi:hypothetical protein Dimus_007065 [Dionaea muscipula]